MKIIISLAGSVVLSSCSPSADHGYEKVVEKVMALSYPDVNSKRKGAYYRKNPEKYESMIINKSLPYIDEDLTELLIKYVEERRLLRPQEYQRYWYGYSSPEMSNNFDDNWIFGWNRRPDELQLLETVDGGKFVRSIYHIKYDTDKISAGSTGTMTISFVGGVNPPKIKNISYEMEYPAFGTKEKLNNQDILVAKTKRLQLLRKK